MIGPHRGSHGHTGIMIVPVLFLLGPGQHLLVDSIVILVIGRAAFFSLSSALGRKVGPGFCPENALAAAFGKPDTLLAPTQGWVKSFSRPAPENGSKWCSTLR